MAAEADNQRRIGRNIQIAREQAGLSQEDAAAQAGMHPTTLSMIETGSREPRIDSIIRLAFTLDVEPGAFFAKVKRPRGRRPRR